MWDQVHRLLGSKRIDRIRRIPLIHQTMSDRFARCRCRHRSPAPGRRPPRPTAVCPRDRGFSLNASTSSSKILNGGGGLTGGAITAVRPCESSERSRRPSGPRRCPQPITPMTRGRRAVLAGRDWRSIFRHARSIADCGAASEHVGKRLPWRSSTLHFAERADPAITPGSDRGRRMPSQQIRVPLGQQRRTALSRR